MHHLSQHQTEVTMAYALANTLVRRRMSPQPNGRDALEPMRGVILWTLIATLLFWVPLGAALVH
jgi:hypothetical protein